MSDHPFLYLSAADVRRALPMPEAIAAMKEAFVDLSAGRIEMPQRTKARLEADGLLLLMPCFSPALGSAGVKLLTLCPSNRSRGLPMIQALVVLAEGTTGTPLGVLEGSALTSIRTGAASGAATDVLARPDAESAAVFGAGVQARTQLAAILAVRRIRRVRVHDVHAPSAAAFAEEMSAFHRIDVRIAGSPAEALAEAEIVCTATTSRAPVFEDRDVRPGTHINAVGVFEPGYAEVPAATVARARVVVDQVEAALEEAGDLLRPHAAGLIGRSHFGIELGDVLAGRAVGRRSPDEITLFKSVGLAVQDLYAAARAVACARLSGFGVSLPR
jgi:alanine dehydrogenase